MFIFVAMEMEKFIKLARINIKSYSWPVCLPYIPDNALWVRVSMMQWAVVLFLLSHSLTLTEGFLPTRTRLTAANRAFSSHGESTSHKGMTAIAILQAAATILTEYPSPNSLDSQNVRRLLNSKPEFDVSDLVSSYYGSRSMLQQVKIRIQFNAAIEYINFHNERVDQKYGEFAIAKAHFDSEQFKPGQDRLISFRREISRKILRKEYWSAREDMGRMLHTLQDFYSHTNWIENWMGEVTPISPYDVLGEFGMKISSTASKSTPTCSDCTKTGSLGFFKRKILYGIFAETSSLYECENNLDSFLKEQKMLTSGYYSGGKDDDDMIIMKPPGKCSHGGITDGTTDKSAKGGINKDSTHSELAPHYKLHAQAVEVAQKHSMQMLLNIHQDVNSDKLFIEFLGLEENPPSSLAIVLVGSHNMTLLLQEINELFSSQTEADIQQFGDNIQYLLVTLNEGMCNKVQVNSYKQLLEELNRLNIQNIDERSFPLRAITCAAKASRRDSPIFVFTDGSVSNQELLGEVEAIVAEKNLQINSIIVGDSSQISKRLVHNRNIHKFKHSYYRRQNIMTDIYQELADFSDGQNIQIPVEEISDIGPVITYSATQGSNTIFQYSDNLSGLTNLSVMVNSYAFEILICVNGENITVSVYSPQDVNAINLTEYSISLDSTTTYVATVSNVTEAELYGEWRLTIQSQGSYSVLIRDFSRLIVSTDTVTYRTDSNYENYDVADLKPLEGETVSAEFTIRGSVAPVTFDTMDIVNDQGVIQYVENATVVNNNTYVGFFISPNEEFKVQVSGTDDNGFRFSYISDVSVEPTTISLQLTDDGYIALEPGKKTSVTVTLLNLGNDDSFMLRLDTDASDDSLKYFEGRIITTDVINVQRNSTANIVVEVSLMPNAPDYFSVTFTLIATSSSNADINDFVTFDLASIQKVETSENSSASLKLPFLLLRSTVLILLVLLFNFC